MSKLPFKPIGKRILVRHLDEDHMQGGILIPEAAREKSQKAEVLALGSAKFEVKVGDIVLLSKYGGTEIKLEGDTYKLALEDDILCVYK